MERNRQVKHMYIIRGLISELVKHRKSFSFFREYYLIKQEIKMKYFR